MTPTCDGFYPYRTPVHARRAWRWRPARHLMRPQWCRQCGHCHMRRWD